MPFHSANLEIIFFWIINIGRLFNWNSAYKTKMTVLQLLLVQKYARFNGNNGEKATAPLQVEFFGLAARLGHSVIKKSQPHAHLRKLLLFGVILVAKD